MSFDVRHFRIIILIFLYYLSRKNVIGLIWDQSATALKIGMGYC